MFSGIVEEFGSVVSVKRKENLFVLTVKAAKVTRATKIGDSISVDGVCLTVTKRGGRTLTFDLMKETLDATTMKHFTPHRPVNLERSLKVNDRIGGHFVTGHIDGTAIFKKVVTLPNYVEWRLEAGAFLLRYIVPKGSVTIDGVSLTVGEVKRDWFSVYLIPHTLDVTTFGRKRIGEKVNIETDILAKYILNR
jgi:riboflavin synthase